MRFATLPLVIALLLALNLTHVTGQKWYRYQPTGQCLQINNSLLELATCDFDNSGTLNTVLASQQTFYFVPSSPTVDSVGSIVSRFTEGRELCLTVVSTASPQFKLGFVDCSLNNPLQQWRSKAGSPSVRVELSSIAYPGKCLGGSASGSFLDTCNSTTTLLQTSPLGGLVLVWSQPSYRGSVTPLSVQDVATLTFSGSPTVSLTIPAGLQVVDQISKTPIFSKDVASWLPAAATVEVGVSAVPGAVFYSEYGLRGFAYHLGYQSLQPFENVLKPARSVMLSDSQSQTALTVVNQSTGYSLELTLSSYPDILLGANLSLKLESKNCPQGCSEQGVCQSNGICTCSSPNWTGSSCSDCTVGFYGRNCTACLATCKSIRGPNAQCDDGIGGTGQCRCSEGFTGPTCSDCVPGRYGPSCSTPGFCGKGFYSPSERRCICYPGYTDNGSASNCSLPVSGTTAKAASGSFAVAPPYPERESCQQGCVACDSQTLSCNQCTANTNLSPNGRECGQIITHETPSCLNFRDSQFAYCSQCVENYYPSAGLCQFSSIPNSCKFSVGTFTSKFYNSSYYNPVKGLCEPCPYPCASCSSNTVCYSCIPPYMYLAASKQCVITCPSGYLPDPMKTSCIQCSPACASCDSGSPDYCTKCSNASMVPINGVCTTLGSCPLGSFLNASVNACQPCHSTCKACTGPLASQCLGCNLNLTAFTYGSSERSCSLSACRNVASTIQMLSSGVCEQCHSSCSECSQAGVSLACLACSNPSDVLFQGQCLPQCPPGLYRSSNVCLPCKKSSGYALSETGQCLYCPGYYNSTQVLNSLSNTCELCSANCSQCAGLANNCTSCADSSQFVVKEGVCVPVANSTDAKYESPIANLEVSDSVSFAATHWYVPFLSATVGAAAVIGGLVIAVRAHNKDKNHAETSAKVDNMEAEISQQRMNALRGNLAFNNDIFDPLYHSGRVSQISLSSSSMCELSRPSDMAASMNSSTHNLSRGSSVSITCKPRQIISSPKEVQHESASALHSRCGSFQSLLTVGKARGSDGSKEDSGDCKHTCRDSNSDCKGDDKKYQKIPSLSEKGQESVTAAKQIKSREDDGLPTYSRTPPQLCIRPNSPSQDCILSPLRSIEIDGSVLADRKSANPLDELYRDKDSYSRSANMEASRFQSVIEASGKVPNHCSNSSGSSAIGKLRLQLDNSLNSLFDAVESQSLNAFAWFKLAPVCQLGENFTCDEQSEPLPIKSPTMLCRIGSFYGAEVIVKELDKKLWSQMPHDMRIFQLGLEATKFALAQGCVAGEGIPGIASVFGAVLDSGCPPSAKLVFPMLQGDLEGLLDHSIPLKLDFVMDLYTQLLSTVHVLHRLGIAHISLCPSNIFLESTNAQVKDDATPAYKVRLADFQLCYDYKINLRSLNAQSVYGDYLAFYETALRQLSSPYIAPEFARASNKVQFLKNQTNQGCTEDCIPRGAESLDVYSLGLILVVILTRKAPSISSAAQYYTHAYGKLDSKLLETVQKLFALARQATDPNPDLRPSVRELMSKLKLITNQVFDCSISR